LSNPPHRPSSSSRDRNPWRVAALAAGAVALSALAVAVWAMRQLSTAPVALEVQGAAPAAKEPLPDRLVLTPASFADLPGWNDDRLFEALGPFVASCNAGGKSGTATPGGLDLSAAATALARICERARAIAAGDGVAARALFTELFTPYRVANHDDPEGLFTGYYEPELRGSRRKKAPFLHPLYLAPRDAQVVDLGAFKKELAGRKVTGLVRDGRFRPYWDRGEIEGGALRGDRLEFLWVDDPVALFFLQIQGSGRVVLPDGEVVRVGYAAQNGHDYTAIGRILIDRGELEREKVSLQTIRAWLRAHPREADAVMNANRSYVFFRVLPGAPVGGSGVELTPGRSLAIDTAFLPYGLPLWIDTTYPPEEGAAAGPAAETGEPATGAPLRRLLVGQDRGGAIRGPVRGDLFWGPGARAEELAGRMKQRGRLWLLWPKEAGVPDPLPGAPG
jgi:membrane-bound lytic murein transglycosylase A